MRPENPEPLWREVVGETEPWRRGRIFLVLLALWNFFSQIFLLAVLLLGGHLEPFLGVLVGILFFWLSFYFIWIGVHWVRWISGGTSCLLGFAKIIWGIRDGNGLFVAEGSIALAAGAYLALAPSVYFFALRQKERMRWQESLVVAAVFAAFLLTTVGTVFGLRVYKGRLEDEARHFADRAFQRVFVEFDSDFLRSHATKGMLAAGPERLELFTTDCSLQIGKPKRVDPARGRLVFRLQLPATAIAEGVMVAEASGEHGPVMLNARIGTAGRDWEIDAIWWRPITPDAAAGY